MTTTKTAEPELFYPEDFNFEVYVHEHNDWADGDCTRCLRLDTYRVEELGHKGRSWSGR